MKKNENLDSKLQILTPNQEIFKNSRKFSFFFFHFFHFFSFSLPVAPEIQESHEKQWKTMENHQKQRKMKKKWSCKWKKNENLDSKLQILTPNQEIFKNSRKFSFFHFKLHFFIFFFHFPFPWHLKSRKTMKNNEKQWKTIKNKGKWKKWKFGLKVADSHSEPGNLQKQGNFHFFFFFHVFSCFFHFPCPWHLKSRKAMKNNGKPSKTKENEKKKWSRKWKKHENLDSKLQILTPNQEIFKNSRKFSFFSFFFHFFHFFSFSLPVAPEIQESHEKQWKTIKNKGKWKKNEVANEKKW